MVTWNKTKIIATIGPASNNRKQLRAMIRAGADVFRLNGAHGTPSEHRETIRLIRNIADKMQVPIAILLGLPGPKLRIGTLKSEPIYYKVGQIVEVDCGRTTQIRDEIPLPFKQLSRGLEKGSRIFLNDGIVVLKVLNTKGPKIQCKVVAGGELRSHKGVNLPRAKLDIPSITKKDHELVKLAVKEKVDYVALSFVRSAKNMVDLKKLLAKRAPEIKVIAKIEKPEALDELDKIIEVSDAIMVARGDLGIEVPLDKIPTIQKDILLKCHLAGKPSITATQMFESMVNSKSPTRAEVTDVANAVWEGSDAVMLSAETSIGAYPAIAVKIMARVAEEAEKRMLILPESTPQLDAADCQVQAVSRAAGLMAEDLHAGAIVTPTRSGRTALFVSKQRPYAQILAPTVDERIARRMNLFWGVRPMIMPHSNTVDKLLKSAEKLALESSFIKKGDIIVTTSGAHGRKGGISRIIEIRHAGES